jgi:signal transduction histidine kinase
VISLQNALLCMEVGGTISHLRKKFYLNQFWKLADRDPVQIHFAALSLQLLSLNEKEDLGLDGKGWWIKNQALIKKYKYPALKSYSTMTFSHWAKRGFPLDSPLLKKKSSQLKETLIFREAQQARMVLNLEKRVQEISLINQIHQRILHNKHIEAFLLQVKDLIFRNFVCDQIQVYLDPRHFTPHSLEILTSLEDLEPWIRNIFYQKGDRKKVFILSPHSDLPRKIASFGYFPFLHEGTLFGGIMITDLEATEERLTVDDGDFLSIVADQISAGVALFFQNMQLENRAVELMFAKEQVENSLKDLEKSQFHLIQTEKASAIGQLVAGVAHEINSPLGAVKSMAGNLRQQVKDLLFKSPELGDPLRRNWRSIARDFIKESTMTGLSTREERKLRRQWEGILVGKPNAEDLAEKLVEMGWQPGNQEFKKWGNESRLLEFGYSVSQIKKMVTVIGDAVRRAQKIVFALKSFTQGSDQANSQPVSLPEGINTVLTLYRNRLKAGVELELDWEGHPTVQGVPEELGQVWTNLIQNALQAMDNHGKLKIIIREEEKTTVIIEDSGPGVPPLLRERIFEPFFTTKKEGEGTGLGLHICKQIIERHQGEIWIGQGAEGAKFCVALPRHWETTHE